ncbi:MAG: hypothetical protein ACT4SY_13695 [Hyphomicrobiales bacterium]
MPVLTVFILGLLFLGTVLWVLLDRHEGRRAARGLSRHGRARLALAAAAMLAVLFTAATALLVFSSAARFHLPAALAIALPPFLGGLLVWHLAMRRRSS